MKYVNAFVVLIVIPTATLFIFIAPQLIITASYQDRIVTTFDEVPASDIAIVFGAHLNEEGDPTPLLRERLEAGKQLYELGLAQKIVVSNFDVSAYIMRQWLLDEEIPEDDILLDVHAVITSDSCDVERFAYLEESSVLFVSQTYHLPRTLYLCEKRGVLGVGVPAELSEIIDRKTTPTTIAIRMWRFMRESGLMWLAVLNIYK